MHETPAEKVVAAKDAEQECIEGRTMNAGTGGEKSPCDFQPKILAVDDESAVLDSVKMALARDGYDLYLTDNVERALETFRFVQPYLVILDLNMPGQDGFAFIEQVQAEHAFDFSIVVLTGQTLSRDVQRCFDLGVCSFIRKPFDIFELRGVAKSLFQKHQHLENLRLSEKTSRENESKYRGLFINSNDAIFIVDWAGKILEANPRACEILGHTQDELQCLSFPDLIPADDLPDAYAALSGSVAQGHVRFSTRFAGADGELLEVDISARYVDVKNRVIQAIVRDMTEQNRLRLQLLHSEKMSSVGQLAAGAAHEINNPIAFVSSNLETLAKYSCRLLEYVQALEQMLANRDGPGMNTLPELMSQQLKIGHIRTDMMNLIQESLEGTTRVRNIVKELTTFARMDEATREMADINDLLETSVKMVRGETKCGIEMVIEYGKMTPTMCFPQQLSEVFINLLLNSVQAMQGRGEILMRTWEEQGAAFVSVKDTGTGIAGDKLQKVFDPFYTTKEANCGTGLGLSICYDVVTLHGGKIWVESEEGRGSTFCVELPIVSTEAGSRHVVPGLQP